MNSSLRRLGFVFALLCATLVVAHVRPAAAAAPASAAAPGSATPAAAAPTPAATRPVPAAASPAAASTDAATDASSDASDDSTSGKPPSSDWDHGSDERASERRHAHRRSPDQDRDDVVSIFHDSTLESGRQADAVVSILGSSTSEGQAGDVVSVLGDTRVTGPVKDNAVAVLGNTYVDSKVEGDVVSVLGDVDLGPHAEIDGDVVSVLGTVHRDPAAIIHGSVQNVATGIDGSGGLHAWLRHCLFLGRPLALAAGLGWAWTLALLFLAFYVCLALLFRTGLTQCVRTVEERPGHTMLAALLTMLLTPVLLVLLCITVIGIAAVPFVVASLFFAVLFGKAVMLAWIGRRILGHRIGSAAHPALAVLIGGALLLVLYLVPVLGFLVYKVLDIVGLGAVVYTLILILRARQTAAAPVAARGGPAPVPPGAAPRAAAAATSAPPPYQASASTVSAADALGGAAMGAAAAGAAAQPGAAPSADAAASDGAAAPNTSKSEVPPYAPATPHPSAAMPRAGFWIRMVALFLDVLLIGVGLSLLHPMSHVHVVALAVYGAVMWKLRGSTVGGIVFDLQVVRLDGRPVDWETAIVRALGCFLSLAVVGLGFIWIAFDADGQAWHDKIAGTVVIRVPKTTPL